MANTTRSQNRWYQFSLRTLLIGVLVLSLPLSWFACRMQKARRQREAVEAIERAGGLVIYDWQSSGFGFEPSAEPSAPKWARTLLGDDFFGGVKRITGTQDFGDDEATYLGALRDPDCSVTGRNAGH